MSLVNVFKIFIELAQKKNRAICERAISELSKTENRIEQLLLVLFFIVVFVELDHRKMTHGLWTILHYLSLYSRL